MYKQIFDEDSANEVLTEHEIEVALGAFEDDGSHKDAENYQKERETEQYESYRDNIVY